MNERRWKQYFRQAGKYLMPTEQVPNFCFERESPEDM